MAGDQVQKPQTNSSAFQRMLSKRHAVYAFIGKTYDETAMYTQRNPKRALKIFVAALGIAGYIGDQVGNHSYDNNFTNMTRIVAGLDTKMISMEKTLNTVATDQSKIVTGINDMSRGINDRFAALENEKRVKQAVEAGEKHVEAVKKARKHWYNPFSWFK